MKHLILITVMSININLAYSQIVFQKTYHNRGIESGDYVQQTGDGGYIVAGFTQDIPSSNEDMYIIKLDSAGDTVWTKTFGGTSDDYATCVRQTTDGGYIIGGYTYSSSIGIIDVCLIKLDSAGNAVWTKNTGSTSIEQCRELQQTADGGYILFGTSMNVSGGVSNMYITKLNSSGNVSWAKNYGGTAAEDAFSGMQTSDAGYIMAGNTRSFGGNPFNMYLIKTDSIGDTLWTKSYDQTFEHTIRSIKQTSDGGYIAAGEMSCNGNLCACLIKIDPSGNISWAKSFQTGFDSGANSVLETADGGFVLGGFSAGSLYVVKTNTSGDTLWTRGYGIVPGMNRCNSISQTADGGYIATGSAYTNPANNVDVYLLKLDSNGNGNCNYLNVSATVTDEVFLVTTPPTMVNSIADITASGLPQTGTGAMVTTFCTTVGSHELPYQIPFVIAPNPSGVHFSIDFNNRQITHGIIEITNMLGEIVYSETIYKEVSKEIVLNTAESGVYFIRISDGSSQSCQKLLISH